MMSKKKILFLIEADVARAIGEFLSDEGYEVVMSDIRSLQDIQSGEGIDIIIFDPYYMKDCLEKIRDFKRKNPKVKLVALNSLLLCFEGRGETISSIIGDGIIEYLGMPARLDYILEAVAE